MAREENESLFEKLPKSIQEMYPYNVFVNNVVNLGIHERRDTEEILVMIIECMDKIIKERGEAELKRLKLSSDTSILIDSLTKANMEADKKGR